MLETLKVRLSDWTDWDIAEYQLGIVLGIFPEWPKNTPWRGDKGVIWSANPIGDMLYQTLRGLVAIDLLQFDDGEHRYRANPDYALETTPRGSHASGAT